MQNIKHNFLNRQFYLFEIYSLFPRQSQLRRQISGSLIKLARIANIVKIMKNETS